MSDFRRFVLYRNQDLSGVSGTGTVAYGCEFPTGSVAIQWDSASGVGSLELFGSIADAEKIHGYGGKTEFRFFLD